MVLQSEEQKEVMWSPVTAETLKKHPTPLTDIIK
jgi:hypothetical protein